MRVDKLNIQSLQGKHACRLSSEALGVLELGADSELGRWLSRGETERETKKLRVSFSTERTHCPLAVLLLYNINGPDPETCVCLLVLDGLLVALSPLLLEDDLHLPLGVLHDRRLHFDLLWWDDGAAAHRKLA